MVGCKDWYSTMKTIRRHLRGKPPLALPPQDSCSALCSGQGSWQLCCLGHSGRLKNGWGSATGHLSGARAGELVLGSWLRFKCPCLSVVLIAMQPLLGQSWASPLPSNGQARAPTTASAGTPKLGRPEPRSPRPALGPVALTAALTRTSEPCVDEQLGVQLTSCSGDAFHEVLMLTKGNHVLSTPRSPLSPCGGLTCDTDFGVNRKFARGRVRSWTS